ncbi:MAG: insulinase family protein [Chlamydiales bacterium]
MNKILIILLLFTPGFCYEILEDKSALKIETPVLSQRKTRKIRLENQLEALLISDPYTKESGAALAIAVGSWDDPENRPGMAHFVEHMLFLGTEKYPEEEGYSRYLNENGGSRNAFTMADRTVYMFSLNNKGFSEALDRFGQFFIAPLFNHSGIKRESKAIHQEFCKDLSLDPWRLLYVKKELANNHHPFHQFCIGNHDTLLDISKNELNTWYQSHYSAHLMHLVVYASEELDSLENQVVDIFSKIKNNNLSPLSFSEPLLQSDQLGKIVFINPIQDLQVLEMSWEVPQFFGKDLEYHTDKLISHVLGHEGNTSLLNQLKQENLAESLSSGNMKAGKDQSLFTLSIHLTKHGVQNYETVIERCFQAIANLRKAGIPHYLFDEIILLEKLKYRFQSREKVFELVSDLATQLIDEPIETFPDQTLFPHRYNPDRIRNFIDYLTPHRCQFTLIASPDLTKQKMTLKEKWMGVDYTVHPIEKEKIEKWALSNTHSCISIPRPNPFLPESMKIDGIVEDETSLPIPYLIIDSPKGKIYECKDTRYLVPEISWSFNIKTPIVSAVNPTYLALADLYCHAVNEYLNSTAYEAMLAGLHYSLKTAQNQIELRLTGYIDKLDILLDKILSTMKTIQLSNEQFLIYQDQLMREYFNQANINPLKQGSELLSSILYKNYAGLNERITALKKIDFDQFNLFCNQLFEKVYIEGMLYGNRANTIVWKMFETYLPGKPFPLDDHPKKELLGLPSHESPSFLILNGQHPANALILTVDCGTFTFKRGAAQEILSKGLEEPFFTELRTRQQTAYLVANWSQEIERHLYTFFAIQSSSHDNRDLLARFELFLESTMQHLKESVIPKERFKSIQTALIQKLEYPAESLSKMGEILHTLAFDYDGEFEWLERRKEAIAELTYEEFLNYTSTCLGKDNLHRLAIFVNAPHPLKGGLLYKEIIHPKEICNPVKIRSSSDLFP